MLERGTQKDALCFLQEISTGSTCDPTASPKDGCLRQGRESFKQKQGHDNILGHMSCHSVCVCCVKSIFFSVKVVHVRHFDGAVDPFCGQEKGYELNLYVENIAINF